MPAWTHEDRRALIEALRSALPHREEFSGCLYEHFGHSLDHYTGDGPLPAQISAVVEDFDARDALDGLLRAALQKAPGSGPLRALGRERFGEDALPPMPPPAPRTPPAGLRVPLSSSFDLETPVSVCLEALALADPGILGLYVPENDARLIDAFAERLVVERGRRQTVRKTTEVLDPQISATTTVVRVLAGHRLELRLRDVIAPVRLPVGEHARPIAERFWQELHGAMAGPLERLLVVLLAGRGEMELPAEVQDVPAPGFNRGLLLQWVNGVLAALPEGEQEAIRQQWQHVILAEFPPGRAAGPLPPADVYCHLEATTQYLQEYAQCGELNGFLQQLEERRLYYVQASG